jgi:3-oxoacyl-[acyl-carrier protein] reductase
MKVNLSLKGKHAVICGSSAGIGEAIARRMAAHGARVTLIARREERLTHLVHELMQSGADDAAARAWDLDEHESLAALAAELVAERGPVQILVNNTGGPPPGPILEAAPADFALGLGRHLFASQVLVQTFLPGMIEAGYGRILNVISTSVREPIPNLGVSNTVRGAMASWSKTLASELPPGITINNLLPGLTDTERLDALRTAIAQKRGSTQEAVQDDWMSGVPEGRLARPEELAGAAVFLASEAGAYIRGVNLPIDGGRLHAI